MNKQGMSRRELCALAVRFGGLGAAGLSLSILSGCSALPSAVPSSAPRASGGSSAATSVAGGPALPTYTPAQAVAPDLPGSAEGVNPGYFSFPSSPLRSVPQVPGRGGEVSMFVWLTSPITALEDNAAWQQLNRLVGATLKPITVPFADYPNRLQLVIAGDDLPDIIFFNSAIQQIQQFAEFLKAKCADLTPYLSGDAVKDYPNLAGLPPASWRGTIYNRGIYGVPIAYTLMFWNLWVHQDMLDQIGASQPTNAAEFKAILQQLTRPQADVYGIGSEAEVAFNLASGAGLHPQIFGAPNNWRVDASGKFTRSFETDEFKAAVDYARDLFSAGVYSPNSLNYNNLSAKIDFAAHKYAFRHDGWSAAIQWWDQDATLTPPGKLRIAHPFAHDGGKPIYHLGPGFFGIVAIKKADPERVKELLRVLNFFAAPFGSQEYLAINYGVEGTDFVRDVSGNPTLTDKGKSDVNALWTWISRPTPVLFNPNSRDYVSVLQGDQKPMIAAGVVDPTVGLYSQASANKSAVLNQAVFDGVRDIVAGRRPASDYDQLVKDWRARGGDQIRSEFEQAYAAS